MHAAEIRLHVAEAILYAAEIRLYVVEVRLHAIETVFYVAEVRFYVTEAILYATEVRLYVVVRLHAVEVRLHACAPVPVSVSDFVYSCPTCLQQRTCPSNLPELYNLLPASRSHQSPTQTLLISTIMPNATETDEAKQSSSLEPLQTPGDEFALCCCLFMWETSPC